jgi:hypothetical protein
MAGDFYHGFAREMDGRKRLREGGRHRRADVLP